MLLVGTSVLAFHDPLTEPPNDTSQLIYTTVTSVQSSWSVGVNGPNYKTSVQMTDLDQSSATRKSSLETSLRKESSHQELAGTGTTSPSMVGYFLGSGLGANSTTLHTSTASTSKPNSSATLSMSTGLGTPQYLDLPRMLVAAIAVVPLILLVIV